MQRLAIVLTLLAFLGAGVLWERGRGVLRADTPPPTPCEACHPGVAARWAGSQHARAQRPFDPARDPAPPVAGVRAGGVIGIEPLQQMLVAFPGGRWQVLDPAWDAVRGAWFSIFGDAAAQPAPTEWGHWTQRGMNWNAQCAACHTTGPQKGYDATADAYDTRWQALGVGCLECHAGADRPGPEVCAPCHARREPLTDAYRAGEPFDEHFRLLLGDTPDLHQADGRAADEVFEVGALRLSAMGAAGVTCLDCHEPHGGGLRRPVTDDALCLDCHGGLGRRGAPAIEPGAHTHHPPSSAGARCVECHMPRRVFMGRDARRDHAFTSPDPALAVATGEPDACSGCHRERPAATLAADVAAWYGDTPRGRARRARAAAMVSARAGQGAALAARLSTERNPAWRAFMAGTLTPLSEATDVRAALVAALDDVDSGVRAAAIRGLARHREVRPLIVARRADPARVVRLAAAWATRTTLAAEAPALRAEVEVWLAQSDDQPAGALRRSELAVVEGRPAEAVDWAERAVRWDPSPPSYHTLARALDAAGRPAEAEAARRAAR